jgi:MFS family permease
MTSLSMPQTPPLYAPRAKNLALLLLAMTQFVIVIDASIVNVALPSIGRHLHFARADLSWVVNAYTLTFGGFLLLGGRLADLLGRRRMFMLGLVLFSVASLAGGIAQSEGWLIVARAVQGLGAAIVSPAALSVITTTFAEGAERNRGRRRRGRGAARRDSHQRPELALGSVRQRPDRTRRRGAGAANPAREPRQGRSEHL